MYSPPVVINRFYAGVTCSLTGFAAKSLDADADKVSRSVDACTSVETRLRFTLVQIHLAKFAYVSEHNESFKDNVFKKTKYNVVSQ